MSKTQFWRWSPDEERFALGEMARLRRVVISDLDVNDVDVVTVKRFHRPERCVTCGTTTEGDAVVLDSWGVRSISRSCCKADPSHRRYHPRCNRIQKVGSR